MKKNFIPLIVSLLITGTSLTMISCKDDEEIATIPVVGIAQDPGSFKGDITNGQVVTLDATKVYVLNGAVKVKDGGKLVIPAGTRIVATAGAASYILVEQGGQLFANGTTLSPVSFSSSAATPGSWGGLIICGKAPVNTGTTDSSEIGNALYGGTASNDNSGSFTYVKIQYAGADFVAGKKFNGLSLFGIGSDTKIENIAVINGAEDGIQLYGGTVNVSNIVSAGNEDDAFVWTDGWTGTVNNMYTTRKADGTGNTGIKGLNNATNADASPRSNPVIKNVTVLGATSGESNGIRLYSGTYATLDNIVFSKCGYTNLSSSKS
ncbi:hypothetical protein MKJ01_14405 [Chryseobacterium sp. SSA4.19]|uniref:hypothetical protein n=1 Tax=Chryseobacterium sp. SSA4.19 TaxID=2919915 RepID=UPI001F4E1E53|nr:hypothetical protein [Chryseobacterium sp. SSA4.19]MCJ8154957.1 hypothetical protein [Chryseobacterium sp. SSA4.19]